MSWYIGAYLLGIVTVVLGAWVMAVTSRDEWL